ncbi:hypothetical protein F3Y22_tig00116976pilonHSYRG00129 [Hibiscus syriacus]|uniref:Uncharacterized protein n=1 Tax=Hibiscus syriacus TaxID=106335 RepID=A0A6A2WI76_HIBSY|nr:hypothetical protein F3Y22_tig00116976pilonHSYRG00129 [Hibiscus syriacus]
MGKLGSPFEGIIKDFQGRRKYYKHDWICPGLRILAPTAYIFFASALPVIAFGEQLSRDTDGTLGNIGFHSYLWSHSLHFWWATIVDIRSCRADSYYVHIFVQFQQRKARVGPEALFGLDFMCLCMDIFDAHSSLYLQCMHHNHQGVVNEFNVPKVENPMLEKYQFPWLHTNGLLAIIFSFGVLFTSLSTRHARSWPYGTASLLGFVADYGVPMMVLCWTALSYTIPRQVSPGVPRRLVCPLLWEDASLYHWTVIKHMGEVPVLYIFAAIVPVTTVVLMSK